MSRAVIAELQERAATIVEVARFIEPGDLGLLMTMQDELNRFAADRLANFVWGISATVVMGFEGRSTAFDRFTGSDAAFGGTVLGVKTVASPYPVRTPVPALICNPTELHNGPQTNPYLTPTALYLRVGVPLVETDITIEPLAMAYPARLTVQ